MKKGLLLALCFFVIISFVSAGISVTSFYSDNLPLELRPGEAKETVFLVKNTGTSGIVTVEAEVREGAEIATLLDSQLTYSIAPGERIEVPIRVDIPGDLELAQYRVSVFFGDVTVIDGSGAVQFALNIQKSFPVNVVASAGDNLPPSDSDSPRFSIWWLISAGLIILIAIVVWLVIYLIRRAKAKKLSSGFKGPVVVGGEASQGTRVR